MLASSRLGRLPGLDGLRALAVVAVLVYHADTDLLPAGFLGVDLFFVVSGFLITALLLADAGGSGSIDLVAFWRRRVRRLVPALLLLLASLLAFAIVALPEEAARLQRQALGALAWVTNWQLLAGGESYFEAAMRPPLLRHLWSLGVEAQFYALWPVVLVLALRIGRPPLVLVLALAGAIASAVWMGVLFDPDADPSRLYFGTDTHLSGLLLGAALAVVVALRPPTGEPISNRVVRIGWTAVGIGTIAGVVAFFVLASAYEPFLYQGGFLAFAALATVLIAAVLVDRRLAAVLDLAPIRWIGERSYSIYLWHWPIYQLTRPDLDVPLDAAGAAAVRVVATLVLAELSYRFVETPIRRGGWRLSDAWRVVARPSFRAVPSALVSASALAIAALLVAVTFAPPAGANGQPGGVPGGGDWIPGDPPATEPPFLDPDEAMGPGGTEPPRGSEAPAASQPPDGSAAPGRPQGPGTGAPATPPVGPTAAPSSIPSVPPILAVGDSVLLSAQPILAKRLPGIEVDAAIGRFFRDGAKILEERRAAGTLPGVVVIHLGNNEPLHTKPFEALLTDLADVRRVVIVNLKVPRDWESQGNRVIGKVIARFPNTTLVDWHAATKGRKELFWRDGYHVRKEGAELYADLLEAAIGTTTVTR